MGILFLLSLGAGLMGTVYGFSSGRYRTDADVIDGLAQPMKLLGVYSVICLLCGTNVRLFRIFALRQMPRHYGGQSALFCRVWQLPTLVLFILFSAMINLIMVSATSKWTFMAFIFVPIFAKMGVTPDVVQCAFLHRRQCHNAITPFLFYMPLVLTYMQQYDKQSSYLSLLRYTWRYSVYILISWTLLFILWYLTGLPLGL